MWREDTVQHRTKKYLLKAKNGFLSRDGEKGSTGTIGLECLRLVHMEEPENAADSN